MHPNADLAKELERCVTNSDDSLANSGLRKGLLIRNDNGFCLTPKGKEFVEKWGKPFAPKAAPVKVAAPTPAPVASSRSIPTMHTHRDSQQPAHLSSFGKLGTGEQRSTQFGRRPQHSGNTTQAFQGQRASDYPGTSRRFGS